VLTGVGHALNPSIFKNGYRLNLRGFFERVWCGLWCGRWVQVLLCRGSKSRSAGGGMRS
jgi:hypothetical protein